MRKKEYTRTRNKKLRNVIVLSVSDLHSPWWNIIQFDNGFMKNYFQFSATLDIDFKVEKINGKPLKAPRVCNIHFRPEDFNNKRKVNGRLRLKKDAVPFLFLG